MSRRPRLALTQGDPAGIGPEILLKLLSHPAPAGSTAAWEPVLVAERAAVEALRPVLPEAPWDRLRWLSSPPSGTDLDALAAAGVLPVLDPVGAHRELTFGRSGPADAAGAMAALDAGMALVRSGAADALVTAPVSKESIARQHLPGFKGHTDYLAEACGLERYGRDYLMAFLAPDLQVALLTVHEPLRDAIATATDGTAIAEALDCLHRHA
jgi:4-hydroxythreonine-4-phosphate dehydrogenase